MVDANCKGQCDASVQAKASCKPPVLKVTFSAAVDAKLDQLRATLEKNLPAIAVAFKARGQAFVDLVAAVGTGAVSVTGKIDASNLKAVSCGLIITGDLVAAAPQMTATFKASSSVAGAVGM